MIESYRWSRLRSYQANVDATYITPVSDHHVDKYADISCWQDAIDEAQHFRVVCNYIYRKIRHQIDEYNLDSFFLVFPKIIEAIAIRPASFLDMEFIYDRRRDIARHVRQMFQRGGEDDCPRKPHGEMSVAGNILTWDSSPSSQIIEHVNVSERFEGLEEDLEEASLDRRIIGGPYKLLIEDLLKESSLDWGESQLWTMDTIRHQIMSSIPTTEFRLRWPYYIHAAEFRIPWQHVKQRLLREKYNRNVGIWDAMPTTVVLVSSSNDVTQATTLKEYVCQTWGFGYNVTQLLQSVLSIITQEFDYNVYRKRTTTPAIVLSYQSR
ncbi:hypothetical protein MFIFM68171_08674 [Madurella fahalii]|uniref:Uncharacterized protein n=1 Tax=Madurella fahalii TaxID=1157608 RepID=A0ABQ0GL80_9PEZI